MPANAVNISEHTSAVTDRLDLPFAETLNRTEPTDGEAAQHHVVAPLTFAVETGRKPVTYVVPPGQGESRHTGERVRQPVRIANARALVPHASLDREGFALVAHDTAVSDFHDAGELRNVYYPEMERLVKRATGASKVVVFDHTTRIDEGTGENDTGARTPVRLAHNDYTAGSAPRRVRDLLGAEQAEALLRKRFAVINVWRPIRGPVETAPLALADAQSVASRDLIATDLVYPDRTGEIYEVAYSDRQRWYNVPRMARDEALLIKGYDSLDDGTARFTPHTAFDDPNTPANATPRESIEVRTLAFFESKGGSA